MSPKQLNFIDYYKNLIPNPFLILIKYLILSSNVVLISIIGDHLLTIKRNSFNSYLIALSDTLIHGIIGFLSWLSVRVFKGHPINETIVLMEAIICGLTASAIDVDHVINARSLHINNLIHLPNRPFLHNTSLTLLISLAIICLGLIHHNWMFNTYGWIFLTASLTHHLRDAQRRGLWFYPFQTKPVPIVMSVPLITLYPIICSILMDIVTKEWLERHSTNQTIKYQTINDSIQEV